MLVPLGDNDIGIFINNRLDLLEVSGLDAVTLNNGELRPIPLELGHSSIPFNMNVKRVVLLAVEERESKEPEYFRHIISTLIVLCKYRNYF